MTLGARLILLAFLAGPLIRQGARALLGLAERAERRLRRG